MKNILKTLVFAIVVPGTVAVLVPCWILGPAGRAFSLAGWRPLGLVLIAVGLVLSLSSAWDFAVTGQGTPAPFDPPKKIVMKGFYRRVRNPMYVGVVLILAGEAVLYSIWLLAGYALIIFTLFNLFIIFYEEPVLERKFGKAYSRYRKEVPRWIPKFKN